MFGKITTLNAHNKAESLIKATKINVEKRAQKIDFDLLGRSLSINPFMPRDFGTFARKIEFEDSVESTESKDSRKDSTDSTDSTPKDSVDSKDSTIFCIEISDFSHLKSLIKSDIYPAPLIINTMRARDISLLFESRISTPHFIIHSDIFISKYQILESLCYGADMVILSCEILLKDSFRELFFYARHLGLSVCAIVQNSDDLEFVESLGVEFFITNLRPKIHKNLISITTFRKFLDFYAINPQFK